MVEEAERSKPENPTSEGIERPTLEVTVTVTGVPRTVVGAGVIA
jgi:hypothetical protein